MIMVIIKWTRQYISRAQIIVLMTTELTSCLIVTHCNQSLKTLWVDGMLILTRGIAWMLPEDH